MSQKRTIEVRLEQELRARYIERLNAAERAAQEARALERVLSIFGTEVSTDAAMENGGKDPNFQIERVGKRKTRVVVQPDVIRVLKAAKQPLVAGEIIKQVRKLGNKDGKEGAIYKALARLEEEGFIRQQPNKKWVALKALFSL